MSMKSKVKYYGSMLRKKWRFPDEWDQFIDYWMLDGDKYISSYEMDVFMGRYKLKNLPKYKRDTETITIDIETPNAYITFFLPAICDTIAISAVATKR